MIKKGDKVKTVRGAVETVMFVDPILPMVTTYESAARGTWYHPTKVFKVQ